MSKQILLVLALLLALNQCKLLFVSEMYRHGARGTLSPFYDGKNQSEITGQLTATGQRQHYNLGQLLRNEYINELKFMSPHYNHSEIYVRADDVDRTIMSAVSHFQGFYPQTFGAILPNNLPVNYTYPPFNSSIPYDQITPISDNYALPNGIQVLPVHVFSAKSDFVFLAADICLNYKIFTAEHVAKHLKDSAYVDFHMAGTYLELTKIFKMPIAGWIETEGLYDVLIADLYNGRPIPKMSDKLWANVKFLDDFTWMFMQSGSLRAVKLVTQPMMEEIISKMDSAISGSSLKWLSLSGHDSNVAPLIRLLNFTNYECLMNNFFKLNSTETYLNCAHRPQFAANVIFELHQNDQDSSQHSVKIRYNGDYMKLCEKDSIECDYTEFRDRIVSQFAKNYNLECGIQNIQDYFKKSSGLGFKSQFVSSVDEDGEQENNLAIIVLVQLVALIALGWYVVRQNKAQRQIQANYYPMPIQQQMVNNQINHAY